MPASVHLWFNIVKTVLLLKVLDYLHLVSLLTLQNICTCNRYIIFSLEGFMNRLAINNLQ